MAPKHTKLSWVAYVQDDPVIFIGVFSSEDKADRALSTFLDNQDPGTNRNWLARNSHVKEMEVNVPYAE